jgi:hypothetical protein
MSTTGITSEQGDQIIALLEKITYQLESIAPDIERIETNTSNAVDILRDVQVTVQNIEAE